MSNKGSKEAEARVKGKSEDKRKVIIVLEKACLEAVKTKKVDLFSLSLSLFETSTRKKRYIRQLNRVTSY
jgi:hypothetical protein